MPAVSRPLGVAITATGRAQLRVVGRGTVQRKRGIPAILFKSKTIIDTRGNKVEVCDEDHPYDIVVWSAPQRSAKGELHGQMDTDIVRIGTSADLAGVDSWSQVEFRGERYDVVIPPAYHHGTREVRHWTMDIRKRPVRAT